MKNKNLIKKIKILKNTVLESRYQAWYAKVAV